MAQVVAIEQIRRLALRRPAAFSDLDRHRRLARAGQTGEPHRGTGDAPSWRPSARHGRRCPACQTTLGVTEVESLDMPAGSSVTTRPGSCRRPPCCWSFSSINTKLPVSRLRRYSSTNSGAVWERQLHPTDLVEARLEVDDSSRCRVLMSSRYWRSLHHHPCVARLVCFNCQLHAPAFELGLARSSSTPWRRCPG